MVSSLEIEELIVRLHKEAKTTREISKEVRKNFTYIGTVLKRRFPEEYVNNDNGKTISKETQALKLFKKGKDLVYVAVKLDMKSDDVKKVYSDFLNLEGFYSLADIHSELGNSVHSLVQACKKIMQSGIGVDKVISIAENLEEIPQIENQYKEKSEIIKGMIQQVAALQNYLDSLNFEAQNKWNEIQNLNYESERLKKILCQIKKGEDYQMTHLPI